MRSPPIQFDAPIWAHDAIPAQHEVVLFRRPFELARVLEAAELQIFADTRYELWVDGTWLGAVRRVFPKPSENTMLIH